MPYDGEIVRSWESDPINTYLMYNNPEIDLVDLLVEGHRIQCELERIFPDLSISEIFKLPETPARGEEAMKIRKTLRDLGYSDAVGKMVAPRKVYETSVENRFKGYAKLAELADTGMGYTEMLRAGNTSPNSSMARRFLRPLNEEELEAVYEASQPGAVWSKVADKHGKHHQWISTLMMAYRYRTERDLPVAA